MFYECSGARRGECEGVKSSLVTTDGARHSGVLSQVTTDGTGVLAPGVEDPFLLAQASEVQELELEETV